MNTESFSLFNDKSLTSQEIRDALVEARQTASYPVIRRLLALLQSEGVGLSQVFRLAIEVIEQQAGEDKNWERCLDGLRNAAYFAQSAEEEDHPLQFDE